MDANVTAYTVKCVFLGGKSNLLPARVQGLTFALLKTHSKAGCSWELGGLQKRMYRLPFHPHVETDKEYARFPLEGLQPRIAPV